MKNLEKSKTLLFNTLVAIVNSNEQVLKITRDYTVLGRKLDRVFIETLDNCGDVDIDSDTYEAITVFLVCKNHSDILNEEPEIEIILNQLKKRFQWIKIYGIDENSIPIFLKYARPFYGYINTSGTEDKMWKDFGLRRYMHD